jgi:hypothetical protein
MRIPSALFAACVLAAFASSANASQPGTDASHYRKYTCRQLFEEARQVSARAVAVAHDLADVHVNDTASAEDAVVIPSVLANPKPASGEVGVLKQKLSAIQDATIQSQCQIEFRTSGH